MELTVEAGTKLKSACMKATIRHTNGMLSSEQNAMVGAYYDLEIGLACSLRGLKKNDNSFYVVHAPN